MNRPTPTRRRKVKPKPRIRRRDRIRTGDTVVANPGALLEADPFTTLAVTRVHKSGAVDVTTADPGARPLTWLHVPITALTKVGA